MLIELDPHQTHALSKIDVRRSGRKLTIEELVHDAIREYLENYRSLEAMADTYIEEEKCHGH